MDIRTEKEKREYTGFLEIEADSRDVEKYHRGLAYTVTVGQDGENKSYSAICASRYKLRNGSTRLKFYTKEYNDLSS